MLLDGYWKKDLKFIIKRLESWSEKPGSLSPDYAEHKVNQGLLYSAVIIRKIVEDEKDAKQYFDEQKAMKQYLKTLFYDVPVTKYTHIVDDKFFVNSKLFLSDYDTKNAEATTLPLDQVCNQLIHSYVWDVIYAFPGKQIHGVMVASDRLKDEGVYMIAIKDWINAIHFVIENATI